MTHPAHTRTTPLNGRLAHGPHQLTTVAQAVVWLAAVCAVPATAAELTLAQVPAGNGGRGPAPNLIISVDDSGSMGSDIALLRKALEDSFKDTAVRDNGIRLGFQAMWRCRGLQAAPYSSGGSCPDNRIQKFSGTHRTNFNDWVKSLEARSGTPSHSMMVNVHNYMQNTTGLWSPFADTPGVAGGPVLTCRKTSHIFMTDGGWKDTNNHRGESTNATQMGIPGNADGTTRTLPDGKVYDPYGATAPFAQVYRDSYAPVLNDLLGGTRNEATRGTVSTLADWAFHMWATDYAPTVANELKPIIRQPGEADFGTALAPYKVPEYWNPKNNPMTWQGVSTYTIGFKNAAVMLPNRKTWNQYTDANAPTQVTLPKWGGDTHSGDIAAMVRGDVVNPPLGWPNPLRGHPLNAGGEHDTSLNTDGAHASNGGPTSDKINELWHMALNGRSKFIPATSGAELTKAFSEIINQVIADSDTPLSSLASNTQTLSDGSNVYSAGYDAATWSGFVQARSINKATFAVDTVPVWNAATVLDATPASSRLIFTHNGTAGTAFEWANLSVAQQNLLKTATETAAVGQSRVEYLRGQRTQEESATGGIFRNRTTKLGNITNSNLWVVGKPEIGYTFDDYATFRKDKISRPTMIYVGANDGMLHGFGAADGSEKMAYVPLGVYSKLKAYTEPSYAHQYTVDGHPFTGDIKDGGTWKTMLVGTLAGGGKGYFVLDVTNPTSWSATSGSALVVTDKTNDSDADMGHMYADPTLDTINPARVVQITKLNNNRWAVLMGNGVNSTSEKAVLLIQYLDGAKELVKIELDSTGGNGNGLANPQVIDIDGDGKADAAYAGDLLGNLWKINLGGTSSSSWGSYFLTGANPAPLFVARDKSGARQPIVTAPQWATHPTKGLMLAFGTGREMTVVDRTTTSDQTLYSVWDNTTFSPKATPKMSDGSIISDATNARLTQLVEQKQDLTPYLKDGKTFFKTTSNAVPYSGVGAKRGWYMDWPGLGERSVNNGGMLSNQLLFMRSRIPGSGDIGTFTEESCVPDPKAAREFLTVLNIIDGKPASKPVFDTDGGGVTGSEEAGVTRYETGRSDTTIFRTRRPGELLVLGEKNTKGKGGTDPDLTNTTRVVAPQSLTGFGWRQLQ